MSKEKRRGPNRITAEEFVDQYGKNSGVTAAWLLAHGRTVLPCDCEAPICEGWQMVSVEHAAEILNPEKPWAR